MKIKHKLFLLLMIVLFTIEGNSQTENKVIKLEDKKPSYISITDVIVGPNFYYETTNSDSNAGYKYRAIITTSEIYTNLYIERLMLDIEGSVVKLEWSKKVKILSVLDLYNMNPETTQIANLIWEGVCNFTFTLGKKKFASRLNDNENIEITLFLDNKN